MTICVNVSKQNEHDQDFNNMNMTILQMSCRVIYRM